MSKAGLEPDSSTTRPFYLHLSGSPHRPGPAWEILEELHKDGTLIPVAAANVALEATVAAGLFDQAVETYKRLHNICKDGANVDTFNILLQGASRASNKSAAMFLAREMSDLGIRPNALTYDRLILICIKQDDYEDAFRYLEEMETISAQKHESGWWPRGGTVNFMVRRCAQAGDSRVWELLEKDNLKGRKDSKIRFLANWARQNWNKEKGTEIETNDASF
jgi:pentatricopeptide repeat protein